MKNEKDFKTAFKKSVKYHKGFSISLAAPMLIGIPDLYVVMPEYMPLLLEAKWLGEIKRDKFSRKIPFTDMQVNFLKECDNVQPSSALGLIGFVYKDIIFATLVKYGTPCFYQFTDSFYSQCPNTRWCINNQQAKVFDIPSLFHEANIPRINVKPQIIDMQHLQINSPLCA